MMRAMMVDSPQDPLAWRAEHQYRLGQSMLVAPIVGEEPERDVYLPAGVWVDWWSGAVHSGPAMIRTHCPLHEFPLFAAAGALIPTAPLSQHVPDGPWREITLLSFGGLPAKAEIRDDDGVTLVTARREGDTFIVESTGPARITGVEFAAVAGHPAPTKVVIEELRE
jgi:alpha-D-xyloside xylohydrolase